MATSRSVAEDLAERVARIEARHLPAGVRDTCERLLLDVIGLCIAARATDYVTAARKGWPDGGAATVFGVPETRSAAAAAFINGTAAHG
ncbi:MAG: MmgE/PrpD family protein, partial [Hyphomicrobiaceae bacterium]